MKYNDVLIKILKKGILIVCLALFSRQLTAQVKIGDNAKNVHPSAILELESDRLGFIWPRLSTTQRDTAFTQNIPTGLTIFNTDDNCIQFWSGTAWQCTGNSGTIENFTSSDNLPETSQMGEFSQITAADGSTALYYYDGSEWIKIFESLRATGTTTPTTSKAVITGGGIPSSTASPTAIKNHPPGTLYVDIYTGNVFVATDNGFNGGKQDDKIADSWVRVQSSGGGSGPRGPAGAPGTPGAPGAPGAKGEDGLNGSGILTGSTLPTGTHSPTDLFINITTGDIHVANGSTTSWTLVPPQSISKGPNQPAITGYKENDLYINTTSNTLSIFKTTPNNHWEEVSSGIYGTDGTLTGRRKVTLNDNDLEFLTKKGDFKVIDADSNSEILSVNGELKNVGIGVQFNQTNNKHSILDIRSGNKGVLFPKVHLTSSVTLSSNVTLGSLYDGMLVFNTNTNTKTTGLKGHGMYIYDWDEQQQNGSWKKIATGDSKMNIFQTDGKLEDNRIVEQKDFNLNFNTKKGDFIVSAHQSGTHLFRADGENESIAIGMVSTTTVSPHAILQVQSDKKGVLFPNVSLHSSITLSKGIALGKAYDGMLVFNTNSVTETTGLNGQGMYIYDWDEQRSQGAWKKIATGTSKQNIYQTDSMLESTRIVTLGTTTTDTTALTFSGGASNTLVMDVALQVSHTLLDSKGKKGSKGQVLVSTGASNTVEWQNTGGGTVTMTTKNYTLSYESDDTILVEPTAPVIVTLPDAEKAPIGKTFTVKRANAYIGNNDTLKIVTNNNDPIDDNSTTAFYLNVSYQGYTLKAFNNEWHIVQRF